MPTLLSLTRRMPTGLVRWIAGRQHQYPLLKAVYRWAGRSAKASDTTIQAGVGAGLRFKAGHGTLGYLLGTVEPDVQRLLPRIVQAGQVVYDVGSNIGFFTLALARLTGPDGRVFAFEPMADNFRLLEHNIHLNGFRQVTPVQQAVSDGSREVKMAVSVYDTTNRVVASGPEGMQNKEALMTLPAVSLDDWVFRDGQPPPDLIKIDVEGYEEVVLRGLRRVLTECHPLLLCEVHGTNASICALLDEIGYWQVVVEAPAVLLSDAHWNAHVLAGPSSKAALREAVLSA